VFGCKRERRAVGKANQYSSHDDRIGMYCYIFIGIVIIRVGGKHNDHGVIRSTVRRGSCEPMSLNEASYTAGPKPHILRICYEPGHLTPNSNRVRLGLSWFRCLLRQLSGPASYSFQHSATFPINSTHGERDPAFAVSFSTALRLERQICCSGSPAARTTTTCGG
jgi:hypothetical protein